jgi:hypothetical protein
MSDVNRDQNIKFDLEIVVLGKNDKVFVTVRAVKDQTVEIYKNIDIKFSKLIKQSKIKKIKVNLSNNEEGVFSIYEKDFNVENDFSYLNIVYILLGIIVIFILIKIKNKFSFSTVVLFIFFGFSSSVFAMPASNSLGVFIWDADPCKNEFDVYCEDYDIDVSDGENMLNNFGINLSFDKPDFSYTGTCYNPGQLIPVVVSLAYDVCDNSPVSLTCNDEDDNCSYSSAPYLNLRLPYSSTDWFWNLRNIVLNSDGSVSYLDPGYEEQFDLDYLKNFLATAPSSNIDTSQGTNNWWSSIFTKTGYYGTSIIRYPFYGGYYSPEIIMDGTVGSANEEFSLIAPEKPGIYRFYVGLDFNAKYGGIGYFLGEYEVRVCDTTHDADFLMPGLQSIDSNGNVTSNGLILEGYGVQVYDHGLKLIDSEYDIDDNPIPYGNIKDPDNETTFLSVVNYCATGDDFSSYYGYENNIDFFTNFKSYWARMLSTFRDASKNITMVEAVGSSVGENHRKISEFMTLMPGANRELPVYSYREYFNTYLASSKKNTVDTRAMAKNFNFIVHKHNNEFKFIDLDYHYDLKWPYKRNEWRKAELSEAYDTQNIYNQLLSESKTLLQMLQAGHFVDSSFLTSADISNIYLVKENKKYYSTNYTCSLYEDFCSGVEGLQYLVKSDDSSKLELWYVDAANNHTFASSTPNGSAKSVVDNMCSVVPPPVVPGSFSAICNAKVGGIIVSTTTPNTTIDFEIVASNPDPAFQTWYNFGVGGGPVIDPIYSTSSSATTTISLTTTVTNGENTINPICSIQIVDGLHQETPFVASCTGTPNPVYADSDGEDVIFTASTTGAIGTVTYAWGGAAYQSSISTTTKIYNTYSPSTYAMNLTAKHNNNTPGDTSDDVTSNNATCSVNVLQKTCGTAHTFSLSSQPSSSSALCSNTNLDGSVATSTDNTRWEWNCSGVSNQCYAIIDDGVPDLDVKLKVQPKIYPSCKAKFDGTDLILTSTETCDLINPLGSVIKTYATSTDLTNETFNLNDKGIYTLKCYEIGNLIPKITSTDVCISNPVIIEQ